MSDDRIAATQKVPSVVQQNLRRRASRRELRPAVGLAVKAFFRFTHRAREAKALWSETGTVLLGRTTFLHWALNDAEIDIPWVVATAANAPDNADELRKAVRSELDAIWTDQLAALPLMSANNWLPLP